MIKKLIQINFKEPDSSSVPTFNYFYFIIVKSKRRKNKSISQPAIWPLCGRQIKGLPGNPVSGARVPRDSTLAQGDNKTPDVIASAAREQGAACGRQRSDR